MQSTVSIAFSVQKGTFTASGSQISTGITSVNTSQSFIIFRANTNDNSPDDYQYTPDFETSSNISFTRYDGGTVSSTVSWQVIQDENIFSQRGSESLSSGTAAVDVAISSVNLSSSFIVVYGRCADETTTDMHAGLFTGNFSNATSIHLERGNEGKCAATVSWQVIDWNGVVVQSGTDAILDNTDSVSPTISEVNLSRSLLFFSSNTKGTDTGMDSNLIQGSFSSSTELLFTDEPGSTYASSLSYVSWFVVESSLFSVQTGSVALSGDTTTTISEINLSRSFEVDSGWNTGGGNTNTNWLYYSEITDATTLSFTKQTTAQTQNIVWYIAEINRPPTVTLLKPDNSQQTSNQSLNFTFIVHDSDFDVDNCSLYSNYTGSWQINKTITSFTYDSENNFTLDLVEGTLRWNVVCVDKKGNSATGATRILEIDQSAPVLTNVENSSITNDSVIIKWDSDELANGTITYGTTIALEDGIKTSVDFLTYQSIFISSLLAGTQYFYNITSCDSFRNCVTIGPYDFNTTLSPDETPPVISNVTNNSIADYSAIIGWITDEDANASVYYGTSLPLTNVAIEDLLYDEVHNVTISGLEVNMLYFYNVTSCDSSGNCNSSRIFNFTTIDTIPPNITLYHPQNTESYFNPENITFNYTVNDSQTVENCSLYLDVNGTWESYKFWNSPIQNQLYSFDYTLNTSGTFHWNVYCVDNRSNGGWAEFQNRMFFVSYPAPQFSNNVRNSTAPARLESVQFNVTITGIDLENYTFSITKNSEWTNTTQGSISGSSAEVSVIETIVGDVDETICYKWYATDSRNDLNESDETCFVIENVAPTQGTPVLSSYYGLNTTTEQLVCSNQSTYDFDGDPVKNIYDWQINGSTIFLTNAPFEGGSTNSLTKDYSGSLGYDLVAQATWGSNYGHDGFGAYYFDGVSEYISLDNSGSSSIYDAQIYERTVALWFKTDSITGTTYRMLFEEGGGTNGMDIYIYDGSVYVGAWSETTSWNGQWLSFSTSINSWHFIALVFDGTNTMLGAYYDGTWQSVVDSGATEVSGHTGNDAIGMMSDAAKSHLGDLTGSGDYFSGYIDDFMTFNRALTVNQLSSLYTKGTSALVANETIVTDVWQCSVTPNDGYDDGITASSNSITILENKKPTWTLPKEYPLSPNNYTEEITLHWFNITWNDIDGIANAWIEANFSGVWTNYSMSGTGGDEYYYTYSNISIGTYQYRFWANDSYGLSNVSTFFEYDVLNPPVPKIFNITNTSITNQSVIITWNTDQKTNGSVQYGTTLTLSNMQSDSLNATEHSIPIVGLEADTTYYYNITSCNFLGTCNTTGPFEFNTTSSGDLTPPILMNILNSSIADYSAIISWNTDENANSSIYYGTSFPLSNSVNSSVLETDHEFELSALDVNTLYYYNITSCDLSGNCNTSKIYNFTTVDTLPPEIQLLFPENSQILNDSQYIDFNFTANDSQTIDNCSLFGDFNGGWNLFYTNNSMSNNQVTRFTYLLNKTGTFHWNVYCVDNSSNARWAVSTNYSFESKFPVPRFSNNNRNSTSPYRTETINFSITIHDFDLRNYTFAINYSGQWYNISSQEQSGPEANVSEIYNLTDVIGDFLCYKWYAYDERDSVNESVENCFEILQAFPQQDTPLLVSEHSKNTTTENLLCLNQSTSDFENDSVKNIIDWLINDSTIFLTNAPFEGGSTDTFTQDYSGILGYNLTASATYGSHYGHDGFGAYYFDGVSNSISLDSGGISSIYDAQIYERTVVLWFKASAVTGTNYRTLYEEGGGVNGMNIYIYDGLLFAGAWSESSSWNGYWINTSVTANSWHMVALVFDGTNALERMFYDGTLQTYEDSGATQVSAHSDDDVIGMITGSSKGHLGDISSSGHYFTGYIDEFSVFSRALSFSQLETMYTGSIQTLAENETTVNDVWKCSITPNDGTGNGFKKTSNTIAIKDNIYPIWNSVFVSPDDPVGFEPVFDAEFNITWEDFDGIKDAYIEHNFSGAWQNYSMTGNKSNEFYYSYSNLKPGNNSYRFWANDTFNGQNITTPFYYLVINNSINSTENITISEDVEIDWNPISFADNYSIYYTDDLDQLFQLLDSGITDTNWTDTSADSVSERYYTISSVVDGVEINSSKIIGKKDYTSNNNWSLITIPFNLTEWTLKNSTFTTGLQIHTEPENCLVSIYRYDPVNDCFSQTDRIDDDWYPATGCDNFTDNTLEKSRGYWFLFNQTCTVSFAGEVSNTTVSYSLQPDYNIVGWFSVASATLPTYGEPPTYPVDVLPANSVTLAIRYNEQTQRFEHTGHYDDWGWWPYTGSESFTTLDPMKSYYFVASQAAIWSYQTR